MGRSWAIQIPLKHGELEEDRLQNHRRGSMAFIQIGETEKERDMIICKSRERSEKNIQITISLSKNAYKHALMWKSGSCKLCEYPMCVFSSLLVTNTTIPSCLHPRWWQRTETSLYLCLQPWESCPLLPLQSAPLWLARTPDSRGDPCPPPLTSPPGLPTTWSHARQPRPCQRCRLPRRATEQVEREANPRQLLMRSTAWHRGTELCCGAYVLTFTVKYLRYVWR